MNFRMWRRVHEQKLVSILNNLLSNAIKFSYENQNILIKLYETTEFVNIEVIDHGIGMGSQQLAKLFDKFSIASRKGTKARATVRPESTSIL
jgi:signal transduction histidine kinase